MNNVINFDSTDWSSIKDTIKKIKEEDNLQQGETSEGETILFSVGHDGEGDTLTTDVFQKNGWIRTNIYHVADYYVEELYKKECM